MKMTVTNVKPDAKAVTNEEWEGLLGKIVSMPDDKQRQMHDIIANALKEQPEGDKTVSIDNTGRKTGAAAGAFKLPKAD